MTCFVLYFLGIPIYYHYLKERSLTFGTRQANAAVITIDRTEYPFTDNQLPFYLITFTPQFVLFNSSSDPVFRCDIPFTF
jgi:hypothetical protein